MIVRAAADRILLITQPDHAQLARRIMECCVPLATRPLRDVILHAIEEHDNGWAEEDAAPRVNAATGGVVDFVNASADVRQAVWSRGVSRLVDDPWAAALVAQHAMVIYDRFHADAAWARFFADITTARDAMVQASGHPPEQLLSDYEFVRLADLTSLAFCTGWPGEQHFGEWSVRLDGTRVLTPDVFGGMEIPIAIAARELPKRPFRSDADLRDSLREAPTTTLQGTVVGVPAVV